MENHFTLKSLSDLSSDAIHAKAPAAPAIPESSQQSDDPTGEGFREEMQRRYTTPFVSAISYRRWELNGGRMMLLIFLATLVIALLAQWHVKRAYARHSRTPTASGHTGAEVAEQILRQSSLVYFLWHLLPLLTGRHDDE